MQSKQMTLPTVALRQAGQSPWLDFISREIIESGELESFIKEKGLLGITSNPSIFEKAINSASNPYGKEIKNLVKKGFTTLEIYDSVTIEDIRNTCDLFRDVYFESRGEHGFVSLEVLPNLAYDKDLTIQEAVRLYQAVDRPNVMIKVPATSEGVAAVRELISKGINVNVTLMFSIKHYVDVAHAYVEGLEEFKKTGGDLSRVHSVASVFVSRIDTLIDKKLDEMVRSEKESERKAYLENLRGKAAVANSKLIYQEYKKIFGSERFEKLKGAGAKVQKVLWGSTSTKNPSYPDLIYVENLVGKETVNTLPLPTFNALLDHGHVRKDTIEEGVEDARQIFHLLGNLGFDMEKIGDKLQKDGVKLFVESFDSLMKSLELQNERISGKKSSGKVMVNYSLAADLKTTVANRLKQLQAEKFLKRFTDKDPSLWKNDVQVQKAITNRLGWLTAPEWMTGKLYEIEQLKKKSEKMNIQHVILLGMGGSSLAAEVLADVFARGSKRVKFYVLDTTDPTSVQKVRKSINLRTSLFIVGSKSGSTIETMSQFQYFFNEISLLAAKLKKNPGSHFIAITDEGSSLEQLAREKKFLHTFINPSDIGGRFSALSFFGMVPAALIGINIRAVLASARRYYAEFSKSADLAKNDAVYIGVLLAEAAKRGNDKLSFLMSNRLRSFSAWLEQLIAESTGKEGQGVIPVEGEDPALLKVYGSDRLVCAIAVKGESRGKLDQALTAAKKKSLPTIRVDWSAPEELGAQFLFWEIVTAVAGVVMRINPFDEPNVRESKEITGTILNYLKEKGKFNESAVLDVKSALRLADTFGKLKKNGYVAILAYLERNKDYDAYLQEIRGIITKRFQVPTLIGYGPRYLHSIGQLYKGGPKTGLFIEFIASEKKDTPVPGTYYSFGQLKKAQALGDLEAIGNKGLPILCVNLGPNPSAGLRLFAKTLAAQYK